MTVTEAIAIVAQHVLANTASANDDQWENYAEVGEEDWEAIMQHVTELTVYPDTEQFNAAMALLGSRADP